MTLKISHMLSTSGLQAAPVVMPRGELELIRRDEREEAEDGDDREITVDCISHDASVTVKRTCRATGKSYQPLRTASVACLVAAVMRWRESTAAAAAE
jgi:hypothetical protein